MTSPDGEPWTLATFIAGADTEAHITSHEQLSDLFGDFRLDAEAYTPEVIEVYERLEGLETVRLGDHAFITDGQHGYHIVDPNSPIRHLTARCIQDWFVDDSEADRLAIETHQSNLRSSCDAGDVLLSTAGTLGKAAIVTPDVLPANMDQDVARIHLKTTIIDPWYLVAFLNSTVGRLQSERISTGQVQKHIALGKIREFLIPVEVDQASIAGLVEKAFKEKTRSQVLYAEAEALLLAELGFDDLNLSHETTYTQGFAKAWTSGRLDAEHYQPKYHQIVDAIKQTGQWALLNDLAVFCQRGAQPIYVENGSVKVINTKHLGPMFLSEELEATDEETWAAQRDAQLQMHDVLLYSTGAYIGRTNYYPLSQRAIGSNHVTIIRAARNCNPIFLALFLNSLPGLLQTDQWAHGSAQREIYPDDIRQFVVWLPSMSRQEEIAQLVMEAQAARSEARLLLEDAKQRVEAAVLGQGA